jgi:purine-nucleoside phosphorylase
MPDVEKIEAIVAFLRHRVPWLTGSTPLVAIVCGSGLSGLSSEIREPISVPYASIPFFPHASVAGHGDSLVFGHIGGTRVVAQRGRFHFCMLRTAPEKTRHEKHPNSQSLPLPGP